jgi:DNA-binding MarR family transcriptional regulator
LALSSGTCQGFYLHNIAVDLESNPHACLTFLVRHAWLSMRTVVAGVLAEHGLSVAQYGTLVLLAEQPGSTVAEVARKVGTARQSANELLGGLERSGLIERRAHPRDRRSQQVFLTDLGRNRIDAASPAVQAVEAQLEAEFSAADREAARNWLVHMAASAAPFADEFSTN